MNGQARNWMFTAFNNPVIGVDACIGYYIYQKEKAPTTGKEHWQGYIEFNKKMTMRAVKMLFGDFKLHLEMRKGTQEQAINYCSKLETRMEEPVKFGVAKKCGKRSDIDEIMTDIQEGATMREILYTHRGNALRMIHCIERAMHVEHRLSMLDHYIELNRLERKDRLDEKMLEDYEKKLFK